MLADSDGASVVSTSSVDSGARPAPCKLRGRRFVTCTSGSKRQRVRYDSSDQEAQLIRAAACSPASSASGASVASAASRFTGAAPRTRTFSDDNSSVGDAPVVQPTQDAEDAHMTEKARRDARRIRNRRSAAISRKRKRDYTKKLEGQVGSLNKANALLLAKLVQVQAERNWFEARASATTPSGAGAAGFNAAASAADAGEAALAAFQLALKQQAAVVADQRRQRLRADMGMPTAAAAPAPLLPAAPAARQSARSDAALSACVDAALDVSAGMPRAGQAPLAPPPAVITPTAHPLRDAEMSRSEAPVTTYSRESNAGDGLVSGASRSPVVEPCTGCDGGSSDGFKGALQHEQVVDLGEDLLRIDGCLGYDNAFETFTFDNSVTLGAASMDLDFPWQLPP